ncbi:MAG TPA: hypothetical protein PK184_20760 [Phycisphaerae bacterium]|jgi:hypothetical protein|nr:hypothetical protein [Phycisphaerae bacterium]HOJ56874.1 hypothetical protein [Phycisphaerae bacterium]HOL28597.1 hypothetical protein [Phycisphaerae bacterium]HPP23106.1 hypothetical protein [Phycisphaerae bacterium]HPU35131.1 hypothetical protein [Phycisphaerae bacterium]
MKRPIKLVTLGVLISAMTGGCTPAPPVDTPPPREVTLTIFHNNSGPMCREALAWLRTMRAQYPGLVVEEYLTTNAEGLALFTQIKAQYPQSQGISTTFGYLPVIFFQDRAFSGFNDEIEQVLTELIRAALASPS